MIWALGKVSLNMCDREVNPTLDIHALTLVQGDVDAHLGYQVLVDMQSWF